MHGTGHSKPMLIFIIALSYLLRIEISDISFFVMLLYAMTLGVYQIIEMINMGKEVFKKHKANNWLKIYRISGNLAFSRSLYHNNIDYVARWRILLPSFIYILNYRIIYKKTVSNSYNQID